jgi:hypothetical protein
VRERERETMRMRNVKIRKNTSEMGARMGTLQTTVLRI